ncbi:MAG: invasion associated locus B family protein [Pseudoruegeria sp.]
MISTAGRGLGILSMILIGSGAFAQSTSESTNRVAAKTDWSVFVEDDPTECWAVSAPKKVVNTKEGRIVAVTRTDTLFSVTYRPTSGVKGEVSFTGGYPFASGSTVSVKIGDSTYEFLTQGENAWAKSTEEDARVIASMKRGASALVTGRSSRGTKTEDTFSLLGFTAALDEAAKRCGG